ncbi:MAG: type I-E CRISPR-associated protein Cas5/CasD, partial [Pseudonocardiaceae bacterium]
MSVVALRLAAPMQSWGVNRFIRRGTQPEPTKSGVLGLIAAAKGIRRTDPLEDLLQLRLGIRVDQPGQLVRDFQTEIQWATGRKKQNSLPLSYRYYQGDAVYLAVLEG